MRASPRLTEDQVAVLSKHKSHVRSLELKTVATEGPRLLWQIWKAEGPLVESGVRSPAHAGLLAISWATTAVKDHKLRNGASILFLRAPWFWFIELATLAASAIADSVVSGQRSHSYVASGGPRWLAMLLDKEAISS
ncbi:BnaA07g38910D [Brassica napus]|uniref:Uncharacterized protein n=3 Tax=Brassica TaxID=3705 RepID=M4DI48_BRACM|nr:unnamed protein product [Brassica napus]CDY68158.1 BnaA07g38910D [Brassica napus]